MRKPVLRSELNGHVSSDLFSRRHGGAEGITSRQTRHSAVVADTGLAQPITQFERLSNCILRAFGVLRGDSYSHVSPCLCGSVRKPVLRSELNGHVSRDLFSRRHGGAEGITSRQTRHSARVKRLRGAIHSWQWLTGIQSCVVSCICAWVCGVLPWRGGAIGGHSTFCGDVVRLAFRECRAHPEHHEVGLLTMS